ncbi:hypothetical protein F8566_43870 [Actinomadura rudentiformis]|uniref:Uncharacterized protein n=1 Tax=Actinomadura rudentiformis TaxID=359158 RepID=A0A6H9YG65_9ACTN|nr:hypothetical protein F8566_43870 [Actinomadura rudentiformis]
MNIVSPFLWSQGGAACPWGDEIDQIVHTGHQHGDHQTDAARQHQPAGVRGPEIAGPGHARQGGGDQERVAEQMVFAQRRGGRSAEAAA